MSSLPNRIAQNRRMILIRLELSTAARYYNNLSLRYDILYYIVCINTIISNNIRYAWVYYTLYPRGLKM